MPQNRKVQDARSAAATELATASATEAASETVLDRSVSGSGSVPDAVKVLGDDPTVGHGVPGRAIPRATRTSPGRGSAGSLVCPEERAGFRSGVRVPADAGLTPGGSGPGVCVCEPVYRLPRAAELLASADPGWLETAGGRGGRGRRRLSLVRACACGLLSGAEQGGT